MALSNSIYLYEDIRMILDAALPKLPVRYELESKNAAIRWRQRAHHYRKLLQIAAGESNTVPGYQPRTPYDSLRLTIVDERFILIDLIAPRGKLTTVGGEEIDVDEPEENIDEMAAELAKLVGEKE